MEDLLEDEDEDFDKDDKVIMSRQTGTKKKKKIAHALVHTPQEGVDIHQENHTHTHTQMNKMTSFPSLLPPPLCLAAQTLCAVIATAPRNLFILARVKRRTSPTFFSFSSAILSVALIFSSPPSNLRHGRCDPAPPASCENTRPYKVLS